MKPSKKALFGASALAAALAVSPVAFAQPCNSNGSQSSNNGYQNSSMTSGRESNNWGANENAGAWSSGRSERYSQLTHEANEALEHDPQLRNENVHAWVNREGVVILRGDTNSPAAAMRAQRVVTQFTGIKKFDNELYYPGMYGRANANFNNENASPPMNNENNNYSGENTANNENSSPSMSNGSNEYNSSGAENENNPSDENNSQSENGGNNASSGNGSQAYNQNSQ